LKQEVEEASLCDKATSGRPVTATAESQQEHVEDMIGIEVGEDHVKRLCAILNRIKGTLILFVSFKYLPSFILYLVVGKTLQLHLCNVSCPGNLLYGDRWLTILGDKNIPPIMWIKPQIFFTADIPVSSSISRCEHTESSGLQ